MSRHNNVIRATAPAKVNLFLHITGKRADGFHLLDSLVVFTEFGDVLEIRPAEKLSLEVTGEFSGAISDENIVLKAARALQTFSGCTKGAHIALSKNIPVGAGIGGGSSDAAAVLKALCVLWELAPQAAQEIALNIGSDVPVCLLAKPALMRGVGEELFPATINTAPWLLLVNPKLSLATPDVFKNYRGGFKKNVAKDSADVVEFISPLENDLQDAAISIVPQIAEILVALNTTQGCILARMSGSGATCFGVYGDEQTARAAETQIRAQHNNWWLTTTKIRTE